MATLSLEQHVVGNLTCRMRKEPLAVATTTTAPELTIITMAMRKLREAIVASNRQDIFAVAVYLFIIRTAIILGHSESYYPALLHLINRHRRVLPLSKEDEEEVIDYYLLDLACRQQDLATAFSIRKVYNHRSMQTDRIMTALVHSDWVLFERAKCGADPHQQRLIQWADEKMADHALQCIGKSYLSLPKGYFEQSIGLQWEELKMMKKLSWTLDDQTVVIKQMRKR
ncbi:MAG: hypothetical protein Q9184_007217 [Pyrenodesmia sp. 2 TL-2023]